MQVNLFFLNITLLVAEESYLHFSLHYQVFCSVSLVVCVGVESRG